MFKNKWFPVLILFSCLFISNSYGQTIIANGYTNEVIGKVYDNKDVLYGDVSSIIETRYLKQANYKGSITTFKTDRLSIDTIFFDRKGIVKGMNTSDRSYPGKYFDRYKTEKSLITVDISGKKFEEHLDMNGDNIQTDCFLKNGALYYKELYKFNIKGYLTQRTVRNAKDQTVLREVYLYGKENQMIEVDDYGANGRLEEKATIHYLLFDKMRNWVKRTETLKNSVGNITGVVTTERKIAY